MRSGSTVFRCCRYLSGLVIALTWTAGLAAQTAEVAVDPAELVREIDSLLDAEFASDQPGAAVIVTRAGQEMYRSARGMANLELQVPLEPHHVFRLGSITKQFTAAAIMMLVEEGKIDLQDEITKFLPDYPTQGATINVEHLLTHTSGIRSYTDIPGWMFQRVQEDLSVEKLIDGFKDEPMDFQPGEKFQYNNSGYVLLGAIIEEASGKSYASFIRERIFKPLEMNNSYYGNHGRIIANRTSGYDGNARRPRNGKYLSMTQPYAAGSLLSTVEDLGKWNQALFGGQLVSQESLDRMTTEFKLNDGSECGYGYGLVPGDLRGHRSIAHGGGIFGFTTFGVYLPDDEIYVAVLCNSTFQNPTSVATKIAALAAGDPFPEFTAIEVDEKILQRYEGVYKINDEERRVITLEDGQLYTTRTGGDRLAATPSSETEFFYETSPSHFEIELDDDDQVTGMHMYQGGSKQSEWAEKVDEEMPAARQVAEIDFAVYDDYEGDFELQPGFVITIRRSDEQLFAQATGQPEFEIFPASETEFFLNVVDAEIVFMRGESGSVDQIVLKQNGAEIPGSRKKQE